jgi:photosystem II stability/assembly factor-like uncharacterized protein
VSIYFASRTVGWIESVPTEHFEVSADGGQTWIPKTLPNDYRAGFEGLAFVDSSRAWLASGILYRSTDGAATWSPVWPHRDQDSYFMVEYLANERAIVATAECQRTTLPVD